MNTKKLVTVLVTNYYRFSVEGDFDPFDMNNPDYQIDSFVRETIEYPERYYFPLKGKRTSEAFEIIENPEKSQDNQVSVERNEQIFNLFCHWIDTCREYAAQEGMPWDDEDVKDVLDDELSRMFREQLGKKESSKAKREMKAIADEKDSGLWRWVVSFKDKGAEKRQKAIAVANDEVIFLDGNIASISVDEENQRQIEIVLNSGLSYFFEGAEAINILRQFERDCFLQAPFLLKIYDSFPSQEFTECSGLKMEIAQGNRETKDLTPKQLALRKLSFLKTFLEEIRLIDWDCEFEWQNTLPYHIHQERMCTFLQSVKETQKYIQEN